MDEIKTSFKPTQSPDIHKARLVFRRKKDGSRIVAVTVCYSQERVWGKERLPFPEDINEDDLYWKRHAGGGVAVYHRRDSNYYYVNMKNERVTTSLSQKLEELVLKTYSKKKESLEATEPELS